MTDQPKWMSGPWFASEMANTFQVQRVGVRPGYAERIADVIYWTKGHGGPKGNPLIDDARANAHLIAAAPDLYAALEIVASELEAMLDAGDVIRGINRAGIAAMRAQVDAARAALAKARGQA